jgi:LCP family protein required for cell wall assembly
VTPAADDQADTATVQLSGQLVPTTAQPTTAQSAVAGPAAAGLAAEGLTAEAPAVENAPEPLPDLSRYPRRSLGARLFFGTGRTVIALASVAVLVATWYAWANVRALNNGIARTNVIDPAAVAPQAAQGSSVAPLDSAVNILVVGMDSRTDPEGNPLPANELAMLDAGPDDGEEDTDTMILIHIPAGGQRAVAISFPRDSYVELAGGFGMNRINSAYAFAHNAEATTLKNQGETDSASIERQADDAGRKNLIDTIQDLTGNAVQINEYAEINLVGFYNLSEAVGGVQVCLKAPTYDDETHAHFPAGVQTLEGVQALDFVRERHGLPNGDLDRIVRQQVFLGSLANKILSANTLASPSKLESLIQAVQGSVVLSSGWDITTFAQQMSGLSSGAIQFATIPTGADFTTSGGADVTEVSPTEVAQFVTSMITAADNGTALPGSSTSSPTETVSPSTSSSPDSSDNASSSTTSASPTSSNVITANGIPCVN